MKTIRSSLAARDKYPRAGLTLSDHLRVQTLVATEKGRAGMVKGHVGRFIIDEAVPRAFMENQNGLLSKALRSPAVVQTWVRDRADAEAILAESSPAGVIAADQALQTSILELLADGEDLDEVGRMVAGKIIETIGLM
ncbi:MAG: hypothetical protein ACLFPD_06070 [Desulfosudaceae bacterium]